MTDGRSQLIIKVIFYFVYRDMIENSSKLCMHSRTALQVEVRDIAHNLPQTCTGGEVVLIFKMHPVEERERVPIDILIDANFYEALE